MVDRLQDCGELGGYRFHQPGIYTYGAGRPLFGLRHNIMIIGWPACAKSAFTDAWGPRRVADTAINEETVPWNPSR